MSTDDVERQTVLWYDRPAGAWGEALPVGDGRLGGMVFGGVDVERIQLNEESVWSGSPEDADTRGKRSSPRDSPASFRGKVRGGAEAYVSRDGVSQEVLAYFLVSSSSSRILASICGRLGARGT